MMINGLKCLINESSVKAQVEHLLDHYRNRLCKGDSKAISNKLNFRVKPSAFSVQKEIRKV